MLTVTIREKDGEEREIVFGKEEVTIGRAQGSDIMLPRNNISKRHARLVDKDDKVVIVDLRSTNGTYVNGRRITAPEILSPEDKVYIGDFILKMDNKADDAVEVEEVEAQPLPPMAQPDAPMNDATLNVGAAAAAEMAMEQAVGAALDAVEAAEGDSGEEDWADESTQALDLEVVEQIDARPEPEPEPEPEEEDPWAEATAALSIDDIPDDPEPLVAPDLEAPEEEEIVFEEEDEDEEEAPAQAEPAPEAEATPPTELDLAVVDDPLAELLADDTLTRIWVNGHDRLVVERKGRREPANVGFESPEALETRVSELVHTLGFDPEAAPAVIEGVLGDGTVAHVVRPPVAAANSLVMLRAARTGSATPHALIESGALERETAMALSEAVGRRRNIVVSGRPGSGRTAVLNALAFFVPDTERLAIIEEGSRLDLPHADVVRLDKMGLDHYGEDVLELVDKLGAERVVIDPVSTGDVHAIIGLALGGHDGLLYTMVSGTPEALLRRMSLEVELATAASLGHRAEVAVAESVDVIVQVARDANGQSHVEQVIAVEGANAEGFVTRVVYERG